MNCNYALQLLWHRDAPSGKQKYRVSAVSCLGCRTLSLFILSIFLLLTLQYVYIKTRCDHKLSYALIKLAHIDWLINLEAVTCKRKATFGSVFSLPHVRYGRTITQCMTLLLFLWNQSETINPGVGGTRMARGGIRLVHGHTKSTLITHFSGMKIDPKYAFLHAFFLICLSCPFQNLSIWPKTHPFFPILHVFTPLKDVRAYSAWSWKQPWLREFLDEPDTPLDIRVPPRAINLKQLNICNSLQQSGLYLSTTYLHITELNMYNKYIFYSY